MVDHIASQLTEISIVLKMFLSLILFLIIWLYISNGPDLKT